VSIVGIEPTGEDANTGIWLLICQFEFKRKPVSTVVILDSGLLGRGCVESLGVWGTFPS
jgi:hypothetical protein